MGTLRNESDRAGLIERMNCLKGGEAPSWSKMTVEQMISHLVQSCEMPFFESAPHRSTFLSRNVIKPLVLYLIAVPKEVKTSAQIDQQRGGRKPTEFENDKKTFFDSVEAIGNLSLDHRCLPHPFFGPMNAKEWARLAHKHIDHHLRQFGV